MVLDFVYLILKNKLAPNLADVKVIEWDENKDGRKGELTASPSLFIGFRNFQCNEYLNGFQKCNVVADFRLVIDDANEGDNRVRKNSSGLIALAREVYIETQRIDGGLLSDIPEFLPLKDTEDDEVIIESITRIGGSTTHDGDHLIKAPQSFRIVYNDYSACVDFQKVVAEFDITNLDINP